MAGAYEKSNIKHHERTCRFELHIALCTTENDVEFSSTLDWCQAISCNRKLFYGANCLACSTVPGQISANQYVQMASLSSECIKTHCLVLSLWSSGLWHCSVLSLDTTVSEVYDDQSSWKLKQSVPPKRRYPQIPYILESNPHPNLIHTSFCRFLKRKKDSSRF